MGKDRSELFSVHNKKTTKKQRNPVGEILGNKVNFVFIVEG